MERFAPFSQDEERLFVWGLHAALARVRSSDPRIFDHRQSKMVNSQRSDRRVRLHVWVGLRQAPIQVRKGNEAELAGPCGCFLRSEVLGSDALTGRESARTRENMCRPAWGLPFLVGFPTLPVRGFSAELQGGLNYVAPRALVSRRAREARQASG